MATGKSIELRKITIPPAVQVEGTEQPYANRYHRRHHVLDLRTGAMGFIPKDAQEPALNTPWVKP